MGAVSKDFISCVEAGVCSVIEDVVFFLQAQPTYTSDWVEWLAFVNYFPFNGVSYRWSLVLEVPDVSGQFGLISFSSLFDVGSVTIPSTLAL